MPRFGLLMRWLMVALCLVPFTSPRQAAAFAQGPVAPVPLPASPDSSEQEDDSDREEEADGKERARVGDTIVPVATPRSPVVVRIAVPRRATASPNPHPQAIDHFRNGLGTPFRC